MQENRTNNNSIIEEMQKNIPADGADLKSNKASDAGNTNEQENNIASNNSSKSSLTFKKDRPQNKNLISLADRTREERAEIGRKGGLKSAEIRRNRQTMKETILELIQKEVKTEKYGGDASILGEKATLQEIILASMIREASNGDTKAMQLLRDTIGEQPTIKTENKTELITPEDLQTIDNLKRYLTS